MPQLLPAFALGFGGGGGVAWRASERACARVCGIVPAVFTLGQIQHKCASLSPRMCFWGWGQQRSWSISVRKGPIVKESRWGIRKLGKY